MRVTALLALLTAVPCFAEDAEIFLDRGETYVRAGTDKGLERGTSLTVVAKGGRRIGSATVMEAWASLARVSLDEPARTDKSPVKLVTLGSTPPPAAPTTPAAPPPPPPPPTQEQRHPAQPSGGLIGHATYAGAGPWTALQVHNEGNIDWNDCTVTMLPMNASYKLRFLRAHDHELIARSNFSNNEFEGDPTTTRVTCREGRADFPMH